MEKEYKDFNDFLNYKHTISSLVDLADTEIKRYCRNFKNGIITDQERISLPYRKYKEEFDSIFKELQRVNKYGNKHFKKELFNYRKKTKKLKIE